MPPAADDCPGVSVVMTVLDEARHLREAVRRILDQDYVGPIEVILALGPSTDGTNAIVEELRSHDDRVRSVPNPTGRTPDGLNAAIAASRYEVIMRCDGHSMLPPEYTRIAVETLIRTGADNVGGVMAARGDTPFQCAVARAMTTKLGVGGAPFHLGGQEGPADTVYLGTFRRSALEKVGGYDEKFRRAQDWEMNHRIRAAGGLVWFTPAMEVTYRPRPTLRRLARQYFDYGRWRREVMRRHPDTVSARYLAPPLAVLGVTVGAAAGLVGILGPRWLRAGWAAPLAYATLIGVGSLLNSRGEPATVGIRLPLVYMTMHGSWGTGFLVASLRHGEAEHERV